MSGVSFGSRVGDAGAPASRVVDSAFVARLASTDITLLDDHDLLEHVASIERAASWLAAQQLAAIAEFARRPSRVQRPDDDPVAVRATYAPPGRCVREFAADEIAARLRLSCATAGARVRLGCALVGLPATTAALSEGWIDLGRARVLVEETAALDAATAREVEAAVIGSAPTGAEQAGTAATCTAARLRAKVRRAALAADPVAARVREVRARSERRVVISPAADGMAELWALLPAASAVAVDTALGAAARSVRSRPGETRTTDQCRADVLAAVFVSALEVGDLGGTPLAGVRGRAVELSVTVAASTLLGHDDQPAALARYGPITAHNARELAPDARWRRILTDPVSGAILDVGRTTYRPSADLVRFVQVRDQRCTFPGCGWPAVSCDLDHTVPFPTGPTSASNLGPRCRRHHRFKQTDPVQVSQAVDGTAQWVLPTGHEYEVLPGSLDLPCDTSAREPVDHEAPAEPDAARGRERRSASEREPPPPP